jgi:SAM-dependent methyltransferase
MFNALQHKPFDRELLNRFAAEVVGRGEVCDMGCGPGHVARYLRDAGTTVFGLDLSPRMLEEARQFNPDIYFREGNMMALDLQDGTLAEMPLSMPSSTFPENLYPWYFGKWREYCNRADCCCLHFTPAMKSFTRMSCGVYLSQWISSFFSH